MVVRHHNTFNLPDIIRLKQVVYKRLPNMVLCKALHVPVYNASVNTHGR